MTLELSRALVSHKGIHFRNKYYSCQTAIKESWFELALINGDWEISIYYDPTSSLETIFLERPTHDENEVCYPIRKEELSGQKLERYFKSIQQLKGRRRKRKTVRKV
jgi:hypothetical protein